MGAGHGLITRPGPSQGILPSPLPALRACTVPSAQCPPPSPCCSCSSPAPTSHHSVSVVSGLRLLCLCRACQDTRSRLPWVDVCPSSVCDLPVGTGCAGCRRRPSRRPVARVPSGPPGDGPARSPGLWSRRSRAGLRRCPLASHSAPGLTYATSLVCAAFENGFTLLSAQEVRFLLLATGALPGGVAGMAVPQ